MTELLLALVAFFFLGTVSTESASVTTTPPVVQSAPVFDPATTLLVRESTGGRCTYGLCQSTLTVSRDGTWILESGDSAEGGNLTAPQLTGLERSIDTTRLPASPPFHDTCPTAYDGSELIYTWATSEDTTEHVDSCDQALDPDDPLLSWVGEFGR